MLHFKPMCLRHNLLHLSITSYVKVLYYSLLLNTNRVQHFHTIYTFLCKRAINFVLFFF